MKTCYLFAALAVMTALACSTSMDSGVEKDGDAGSSDSSSLFQGMLEDPVLVTGPVSPAGLQVIFATPDLGLGSNRIGFVVVGPQGVVRLPEVDVSSFHFPSDGSAERKKETSKAVSRPWPYNTRGLYTTELSFDVPGDWGLEVDIPGPGEIEGVLTLRFPVAEVPSAVATGGPAVRSKSKTLNDVDDIGELTTGFLQDADLYQISIAEALDNDMPTVVVMASPAFCINAVCGPQVDVLQELKEEYRGRANFIHVDLYDNPHEIQGDLDVAVISPTVMEWRLPSSEWSFVIDRTGAVTARFESFATYDELALALEAVL